MNIQNLGKFSGLIMKPQKSEVVVDKSPIATERKRERERVSEIE